MALVHPNAAGIEIGGSVHVVISQGEGCWECTHFWRFNLWPSDCKMAPAVRNRNTSTRKYGYYWKNLFNIWFKTDLRFIWLMPGIPCNFTGKRLMKVMPVDTQIQRLHSCGFLNSSFLPGDKTETWRTMVRHRRNLSNSSTCILRMQRSLELMMNLKYIQWLAIWWVKPGQQSWSYYQWRKKGV
jgi:hypothetical protein